jgi:3-hydroxyacyl-CoA dehydrogenase, NAD binding domain
MSAAITSAARVVRGHRHAVAALAGTSPLRQATNDTTFNQSSRAASTTTAASGVTIRKVGVLGLGLMGHGIVQATATAPGAKYEVVGLEATEEAVGLGRSKIEQGIQRQLSKAVAKGKLSEGDAQVCAGSSLHCVWLYQKVVLLVQRVCPCQGLCACNAARTPPRTP